MTSLTVWLYVSSGLVIGLLTAFAIHNQKVGWKKSRTTLAEALDDLYSDLGLSVQPAQTAESGHLITVRRVETDPGDFSDQLMKLTKALGQNATVKPAAQLASARDLEHQLVSTQVR